MKAVFVIAVLLLFVAKHTFSKRPYPVCDVVTTKEIIHNFCELSRDEVQPYSDCNDENKFYFSIAGPACAMTYTKKKCNSLEDIYDVVCENKGNPSDEVINLVCCDVTVQQLYRNLTTLEEKHQSNKNCAKLAGAKGDLE